MERIYPFDFALSGITVEFIAITAAVLYAIGCVARRDAFRFQAADGLFAAFVLWHGGRLILAAPCLNAWTPIQAAGCLCVYFCARNIRAETSLFRLLFLAGIWQAAWGVCQWQGLLPSYHPSFPSTGGFFNPALWGIFCVCGLLAGIPLHDAFRTCPLRILWAAGMALLLAAILLSGSRTAWLALAAGASRAGWTSKAGKNIRARLNVRTFRPGIRILLCITAATAVGATAYGLYALRPDSVQGRFLIWQVIAGRLPDAPLCGHGALQAQYMPMQAAWFAAHPGSPASLLAGENVYAFNEFLRVAFESGVIGLALFAGTLVAAFLKSSHARRTSRHAGNILLAILCFGCFGYPLSSASITATAILSLAVMVKDRRPLFTIDRQTGIPLRRILACIGIAFAAYAATGYATAKSADRFLAEASRRPALLEAPEAARHTRRLRGNPDFMLTYGKMLYNRRHYDDALPVLSQASRLKPSSRLWCDLGDCHRQRDDLPAAEQAYRLAASMLPARILPRYRLFCLFRDSGATEKAAEEAARMLDMPVKVVNSSVLRYRHQARLFLNRHSSTP